MKKKEKIKKELTFTLMLSLFIISILFILVVYLIVKNNFYATPSCDTLLENIQALANQVNYCEMDEDCEINLDFNGCNLGCYLLYNKNAEVENLMGLVKMYKGQCTQGCFKDCLIPQQTDITCRNHLCAYSPLEVWE